MIVGQIGSFDVKTSGVCKPQTTSLGTLSLNNNHAIGTARTIDSGGRTVFQQRNRFNLILVQVHHTGKTDLKAVHNDQWRIEVGARIILQIGDGGQVGGASDLHVGQVVRVRTELIVHQHIERRVDVGDRSEQVLVTKLLQLLIGDGRNRPRKGILVFPEDTCYDHVLNRCVRPHRQIACHVGRSRFDCYIGRFHTDIRKADRDTRVGNAYLIHSVQVSHSACLAASVIDRHTNQRLTLFVFHLSPHRSPVALHLLLAGSRYGYCILSMSCR